MKQFFKILLATILGLCLFFGLFVLILIGIGVGVSSFADKEVTIKPNSVLHIQLNTPVVDRASENPFEDFDFGAMESRGKIGLNEILRNLKKAEKDDNIKGVYLDLSFIEAGMATVEEIRDALQAFKDSSGKFVISYSEVYTQKAYYLASVSDEIYLYPEGMVEFKGLSTTLMFMKGLFEKLEIEPQIIRHGKFKSAVEPLIYDKMSEANKEQSMTYVGSLWNQMIAGISKSRGVSEQELNLIADSLFIRNASDAVNYKLVDGVLYGDELEAKLRTKLGTEEKEKIAFVKIKKYSGVKSDSDKGKLKKDKVAVIYAQGSIESGKGDHESIGSETLAAAIKKAREDDKIKAIVLRVNSPGGSALASDVMWREMVLAKKAKPVVVSMGDVAASGGYYIACAADRILASENTITGSIGVFGVIPNFQKFFNNKLGITFDGVKSNANADLGVFKPLSTQQRNIIQNSVEVIYDSFIGKVAEGRGISKAEVDSIGQGRVWSGTDAISRKLVDEFGGLSRAIEVAAELAKLEDYRVIELPEKKEPFEEFISEFMGEHEGEAMEKALGHNAKYVSYLKSVSRWNGVQTRLPYYIEIE